MMNRSIILFFTFILLNFSSTVLAMTRREALRELGLSSSSASEAEIKKAYRKRSLETHPDKGGSNEEFVRVAEAYQLLTGGGFCGSRSGDGASDGGGFDMSDDEKLKMANDMFFEMFDEFLTDTDAAADKVVDWIWDFFENVEFEKTTVNGKTQYTYKQGGSGGNNEKKSSDNSNKPKKDGMFKSFVRWCTRKGIKIAQTFLEGDNMELTINGQKMTGADFKKFREQAQQRVQQRKKDNGM